jgi:hypothetical protein
MNLPKFEGDFYLLSLYLLSWSYSLALELEIKFVESDLYIFSQQLRISAADFDKFVY